jgi:hypothetical protein
VFGSRPTRASDPVNSRRFEDLPRSRPPSLLPDCSRFVVSVSSDGVGQPFWEHISPIPTVNPEQCPPYWAHSGSPQVQSEHWPALGTGRHAHWVVPSAGLRTFTIC